MLKGFFFFSVMKKKYDQFTKYRNIFFAIIPTFDFGLINLLSLNTCLWASPVQKWAKKTYAAVLATTISYQTSKVTKPL